jgi:hypothetical protein
MFASSRVCRGYVMAARWSLYGQADRLADPLVFDTPRSPP